MIQLIGTGILILLVLFFLGPALLRIWVYAIGAGLVDALNNRQKKEK